MQMRGDTLGGSFIVFSKYFCHCINVLHWCVIKKEKLRQQNFKYVYVGGTLIFESRENNDNFF